MGCFQTVCLWRLIRPMARSCYILTDYDAVSACHSRSEPVRERSASIELPTARASRQRARDYVSSHQRPDFHCSMEGQVPENFSVRMSLAGIEPVGFRVKSDLRNHQAIVQP